MSKQDDNSPNKGSTKGKSRSFQPKARRKTRTFLLQAIYQWQVNKVAISALEAQFRSEFDMSDADIVYFREVLEGVLTHTTELDALYEPYLDRNLDNVDMIEKAILRLGAYELQHRMDVPYQVVLNEGIELAKTFGAEESHKYVNGILDRLSQRVRRTEFEAYRQRRRDKHAKK